MNMPANAKTQTISGKSISLLILPIGMQRSIAGSISAAILVK